ncbi:MAG: HlyD family efflux transporter periplasmic adaptor subunit [Spirochaetales bacterium]|nr:MAG: HlyD family efflux transporter periplasmic adaptor subunit [Spirochaetales bacterium]
MNLNPTLMALSMLVLGACSPSARDFEASGTIEATEVRVSSQVVGIITEINAMEGSTVQRGDILARIDSEAYRFQVGGARATVDAARAQLDLLVGGARAEDIMQAKSSLDQADENLRLAEADAARMRDLAASGSATAKQRDDAESRFATAKAQRNSAEQALRKLETFTRPEELRAARARLEQAEWALKLAEKSLSNCDIRSPIAGTVLERLAERGELAMLGSGISVLGDLDALSLTIYLPETEIGWIALGQAAQVSVDSFPGKNFEGMVSFISPKAEFTPKNVQTKDERVKQVFAVRLDLGSGEGLLKPGMPADALIVVAGK